MDSTQTMLKAIINGQSSLKQELLGRIDGVEDSLGNKIDKLDKKIDQVEKKLTKRIDKIGGQLAYLEDDAPTREEFDELSEEVSQLKIKIASV